MYGGREGGEGMGGKGVEFHMQLLPLRILICTTTTYCYYVFLLNPSSCNRNSNISYGNSCSNNCSSISSISS